MSTIAPPPTYADVVVISEISGKPVFNPVWLDWFLRVAQKSNAALASNLAGGAAGKVLYQVAVDTTGFTAVGTAGQALLSGGTATPTWTAGKLALAGDFTTSGAFATTFTFTGITGVTFPTSGTLATLAGAESLTNKKLGSLTTNGFVQTSAGDGTLSILAPAANMATWINNPTSANLAATVTDETGTGALVFASSPTFTTPRLSGYTVAGLPAAGTAGRLAYATDLLAHTFGANAVGGGTVVGLVFDNGANWVTM